MVSFCRIARRVRSAPTSRSTRPDALIVGDPTLLHQVDVFGGLQPDGYVLVNTSRDVAELGLDDLQESLALRALVTVPATEMAREHLGPPAAERRPAGRRSPR